MTDTPTDTRMLVLTERHPAGLRIALWVPHPHADPLLELLQDVRRQHRRGCEAGLAEALQRVLGHLLGARVLSTTSMEARLDEIAGAQATPDDVLGAV